MKKIIEEKKSYISSFFLGAILLIVSSCDFSSKKAALAVIGYIDANSQVLTITDNMLDKYYKKFLDLDSDILFNEGAIVAIYDDETDIKQFIFEKVSLDGTVYISTVLERVDETFIIGYDSDILKTCTCILTDCYDQISSAIVSTDPCACELCIDGVIVKTSATTTANGYQDFFSSFN